MQAYVRNVLPLFEAAITKMAIEQPNDPYQFLAEYFLARTLSHRETSATSTADSSSPHSKALQSGSAAKNFTVALSARIVENGTLQPPATVDTAAGEEESIGGNPDEGALITDILVRLGQNDEQQGSIESITSNTIFGIGGRILAGASSNASSSQTSTRCRSQLPFPLYNDILLHVVSFLQTDQMHTAAQLSKQWYHVLISMKPLRSEPRMFLLRKNIERIPPKASCTIGRHFKCRLLDALMPTTDRDCLLLLRLQTLFPFLIEMTLEFVSDEHPHPLSRWSLPSSLQKLTLQVSLNWHAVIFPMVAQLTELRELNLSVIKGSVNRVDFSPLKALQNLDSLGLTLSTASSIELCNCPSLCEFLQQAQLTHLEVNRGYQLSQSNWITSFMKLVSNAPHCNLIQSGKLVAINTIEILDRPLLETLIGFPSLTELKFRFKLSEQDATLLQQLPNIELFKPMRAWGEGAGPPISITNVLVACHYLPNVRELELSNWDMTSNQLDECLASLPKLTSLQISMCDGITTIAPLIKYGLTEKLRCLELTGLDVTVGDLTRYVLPLVQLRILSLKNFKQYYDLPQPQRLVVRAQLLSLPNLDKDNDRNVLP